MGNEATRSTGLRLVFSRNTSTESRHFVALVNLIGLMDHARRNKYGVGAFNVPDYETFQAILDTAVAKQSPVIIDVAEVHLKYIDLDDVAYVVKRAAERAPVPVALHLDHGEHFETIIRAVRAGFSSIMFDGSHLPFEENVRQTAEIVRICHACGVSVEAELGQVLGGEGTSERFEADPSVFTDPDEAVEFCARTNIDLLAISFGTAHGLYRGTPKLDFDRLDAIATRTKKPVVLHGGTGVSDEDFRKAVSLGITKINYYTQTSVTAVEATREILAANPDLVSYPLLLQQTREAIKKVLAHQMDVFGSAGICARFPDICIECDACTVPNVSLDGVADTGGHAYQHAPASAPADRSDKLTDDDVQTLIDAVTRAVLKGLNDA